MTDQAAAGSSDVTMGVTQSNIYFFILAPADHLPLTSAPAMQIK